MPVSASISTDDRRADGMPGSTARTAISFVLFVHLFFLLAAVVSSNGFASQLERGLRNVPGFRPYAEALGLDWPFAYGLTYGTGDGPTADTEHWIEVDLELAGGAKETVVLPPKELRSTQRKRRYDSLVRNATIRSDPMNEDSTILHAIASSYVAREGATRGTIRIRRKDLPQQPFYTTERATRTIYEARILVTGGEVKLFKIESASDSAPAAARGATPKKTP
jgi:hypothetical protein